MFYQVINNKYFIAPNILIFKIFLKFRIFISKFSFFSPYTFYLNIKLEYNGLNRKLLKWLLLEVSKLFV